MWNLFKLTNLFWLLSSTYIWITAIFNQGPILIGVNMVMAICLSLMPIKFKFDALIGRVILAIIAIGLWFLWIDGAVMGLVTILMFMPVVWLLQLPFEYKVDLLKFTTKWYAILLIPAIFIYWTALFIKLPSFGKFVHPNYVPYTNYLFYIKTTWDSGMLVRFNAFFLEPGHLALLSTFMLMANRFRFKECPWLWVLLLSIIFSFSLAGYLLAAAGFILLKVNTILKALIVGTLGAVMVAFAISWSGGNNALNDLIISRLEKDESNGIKGNNRFEKSTDYAFAKAVKHHDLWQGVKNKTNIDTIEGAGYKIFIIYYGLIGVILALLVYLSLIPSHPDHRYTISFLIILALCFMQRAYPAWYSWLFPYVIGIYLAKGEKKRLHYID